MGILGRVMGYLFCWPKSTSGKGKHGTWFNAYTTTREDFDSGLRGVIVGQGYLKRWNVDCRYMAWDSGLWKAWGSNSFVRISSVVRWVILLTWRFTFKGGYCWGPCNLANCYECILNYWDCDTCSFLELSVVDRGLQPRKGKMFCMAAWVLQ